MQIFLGACNLFAFNVNLNNFLIDRICPKFTLDIVIVFITQILNSIVLLRRYIKLKGIGFTINSALVLLRRY